MELNTMEELDPFDPQQQIGLLIDNKYKLSKILGEGSFAVVFLAKHIVSKVPFAVKCLYRKGLSENQKKLQMEEVQLMLAVNHHPNIVHLHAVIETNYHLYLVMDYCATDLFDYIINHPLDEVHVRKLFNEIVEAVSECHEHGIYHRDLKPENILLVNKKGPVKLTDFGLATKDVLSSDYGCGSVCYMSPENRTIKSGTCSPYLPAANDVWSLGVILINLLTGKNPWHKPSKKDSHFRCHILSTFAQDSFQVKFGFSLSLCQVLRKVFSLDPHSRPTPKQFSMMLENVEELFCHSIPTVKHNTLVSSTYDFTKMKNQLPCSVTPQNIVYPHTPLNGETLHSIEEFWPDFTQRSVNLEHVDSLETISSHSSETQFKLDL
ncbi:hypothetical protein HDV02_003736 [Globomyces sp. JEL0801]|nr:hypothetical protein HDV02_003736 [Globomyces sp. JEL0801]